MAPHKNWNEIVKTLSSPEASDEEDGLNFRSVQKNAHRVAELMHGVIPGLDRERAGCAPVGMNRPDVFRNSMAKAYSDAATATPRTHAATQDATSTASHEPTEKSASDRA